MYFWILKSIAGALLGSASSKWFSKTKLGHWCFEKFESLMDWAKDRYGINLLDKEDIELAKRELKFIIQYFRDPTKCIIVSPDC